MNLSPETVEAMRDLLAPPEVGMVSEADLLRVALGVADDATQLAYARAAARSPGLRMRLVRARAAVRENLAERAPEGADRDALECLSVFRGPFTEADAIAVFPFIWRIDAHVQRGWLVRDEVAGVPDGLRVAEALRSTLVAPQDGRLDGFASWGAETAERIARTLAEGLWPEGSAALRARLPDLGEAWSQADRRGEAETVRRLAEALVPALVETGEWVAFADLAVVGHRAAERLGDLRLRSWLLSFQGVAASYQGDSVLARTLWCERLILARERGSLVAEADTLLDLAEQASTDRDDEECERWLREAKPVVLVCGRPSYLTTWFALRALVALRGGNLVRAQRYDGLAQRSAGGTEEARMDLFVRLTHAKVVGASGRRDEALDVLVDVLERTVSAGRAVDGAATLLKLAPFLESMGLPWLAERGLQTARGMYWDLGCQRLAKSERLWTDLRARHSDRVVWSDEARRWDDESKTIINALKDHRGNTVASR